MTAPEPTPVNEQQMARLVAAAEVVVRTSRPVSPHVGAPATHYEVPVEARDDLADLLADIAWARDEADDEDFIVEVFRNSRSASVRVTHTPTGLIARREDVRSVVRARGECLTELRERLGAARR